METELDPEARDTLYRQTTQVLQRDMPVTFLFPGIENYVVHRRIRGFRLPRWAALAFVEVLWIEEDEP